MYQCKRLSTTPASPIRIQVDASQGDGDGGFQMGGVFDFLPAGQDGDTHQVGEAAARAIMLDHGLAGHFECTPPIQADAATSQGKTKGKPDRQ